MRIQSTATVYRHACKNPGTTSVFHDNYFGLFSIFVYLQCRWCYPYWIERFINNPEKWYEIGAGSRHCLPSRRNTSDSAVPSLTYFLIMRRRKDMNIFIRRTIFNYWTKVPYLCWFIVSHRFIQNFIKCQRSMVSKSTVSWVLRIIVVLTNPQINWMFDIIFEINNISW